MQANIEILKRDILSCLNLKTVNMIYNTMSWSKYSFLSKQSIKWPKWCLFLEKSCNQEKDYGAEQKQCLTYKGKKRLSLNKK